MKKLILLISAVALLTIGVKAQSPPDMGFENWAQISPPIITIENPVGWTSLNVLNAVSATPISVTKETSAPYAGTISAKITTVWVQGVSIPNPYRPGKNLDTAGILSIGKTQFSAPYLVNGFTYAKAPTVLSFACKYTPIAGDSAFVLAFLTKKNAGTGKRDTIATGKFSTAAIASYTVNSLTMTYKPAFVGVVPDSQQIFISSSIYSHAGAKTGSEFIIDDLVWSNFVGVNDLGVIDHNVSVFPNPANEQINFSTTVDASIVEIMDVTGRLMGSYKMINNKLTIPTASFVPGAYLYNVLNDKKIVINRGKFEVTK